MVIFLISLTALLLTSCGDEGIEYDVAHHVEHIETDEVTVEIIPADEWGQPLVAPDTGFPETVKIHPNMPEFTITRIVGDYMPEGYLQWFPEPREVSILIADENGEIIQEIHGLTQSTRNVNGGLSFDDYNFDGYLDMRLMQWQDGAGGLLAQEYFWLWDSAAKQFVLHEQLVQIGHAAWLGADQERQRIYVGNRYSGGHHVLEYEYDDGVFSVVYRGLSQVFDCATERFVVTKHAHLVPDILDNTNVYTVNITIETTVINSEVIQEFTELGSSYMNPPLFGWQPHPNDFNPLNFHVEYLRGSIIMGLRKVPGGSLMNDPHHFWIWDAEERQFAEHTGLRELSDFGTVSLGWNHWHGMGFIHTVFRMSHGLYIWKSYDLIDGEPMLLQTRERVTYFDGEDWRIKDIITNHTDGIVEYEFVY
ncbi:MAG: hypothetical protein FWB80_05275 [Defluviitaleaceae bacterium]|nr:hypothetical protein [Defluviitaleaceae bacterium]